MNHSNVENLIDTEYEQSPDLKILANCKNIMESERKSKIYKRYLQALHADVIAFTYLNIKSSMKAS